MAEDGNQTQHLIVAPRARFDVLDTCSSLERDAVDVPLTTELRAELDAVFKAEGAEGFSRSWRWRTLRCIAAESRYGRDEEQGMTFRGFSSFRPAEGGRATDDRRLAELGIRIKVISGEIVSDGSSCCGGRRLDSKAMSRRRTWESLRMRHRGTAHDVPIVVVRSSAEGAYRRGLRIRVRVGNLGDGINDAPAGRQPTLAWSKTGRGCRARKRADIIRRGEISTFCVRRKRTGGGPSPTRQVHLYHHQRNFGNPCEHGAATLVLLFLPLVAKQIPLNYFFSNTHSITTRASTSILDRVSQPSALEYQGIQLFMVASG